MTTTANTPPAPAPATGADAVKPAPVLGEGGWAGWLVGTPPAADGTQQALIQIEPEGTRIIVPAELAARGADGVYRVPLTRDALLHANAVVQAAQASGSEVATVISPRPPVDRSAAATQEQITVPVVEERLTVGTEVVPTGRVRVRKTVTERQETVNRPVLRDEVSVERVPVNRVVEGAPPGVRQEGDVMVVPLLEEVLVVEKRMMVREELRIHLRRDAVPQSQTVTLRREEAHVERFGPESAGPDTAAVAAAADTTVRPMPAGAEGK
jgi:uncharacterized protein (TIGR02271 family)